MTLHTSASAEDKIDTTALWHKLREEITMIPSSTETWPAATFGHIMGGYDAGYYGYLWSEVFSSDMFVSMFAKEGVKNQKIGRQYREKVLGPGGSKYVFINL